MEKIKSANIRRHAHSRAFTLIEITFAILILAGSLVVLLGLQSSSLDRAVRDRENQSAMLLARKILTMVEVFHEDITIDKTSGEVDKVLEDLFGRGVEYSEPLDPDKLYKAEVRIVPLQIPPLDKDVMKRLELVIYWSDDPLDQVILYYYFPIPLDT